jgi:hypothetical protein
MMSIWRRLAHCAHISGSLIGPALAVLFVVLPLACVLHCHFLPPYATDTPAGALFICHPLPGDPAETPAPISFATLRALAEMLPAILPILALLLACSRRILPLATCLPAFLSHQPPLPPPRLH